MVRYHPAAQAEFDLMLKLGRRGLKACLGQMIRRHYAISDGSEPLDPREDIGLGPSGKCKMYEVTFSFGVFARLECIYESDGVNTTLLALDGHQGTARLGRLAPLARGRAWSRAS